MTRGRPRPVEVLLEASSVAVQDGLMRTFAIVTATIASLAVASVAMAAETASSAAVLATATPESPSPLIVRELLRFLGRLHPMIVHFPVALLVCAGMLEILALKRPSARPSARTCLYIGAASSIVAAGMGWLIAAHEPHSRSELQVLEAHRWTGIATAVFAVVAAILAAIEARRSRPTLAAAYRYALFSSVLVVSFAGHMGGALVYGEDYALRAFSAWREATKKPKAVKSPVTTPGTPQAGDPTAEDPQAGTRDGNEDDGIDPGTNDGSPDPATGGTPPINATTPVDFLTQIQPIFEEHCYECHGPEEAEGDLVLHLRSGLFHDEPNFWSVIPGDPDESLLVEMIEYPADDPDFMPAEGEPLPADQIALIRRWVSEGAIWPEPGNGGENGG